MKPSSPIAARRGSALIACLLFGLVISLVLGSFLELSLAELKQSDTSYVYNALLNLAEAGTEEASWALNREDWSGWLPVTLTDNPGTVANEAAWQCRFFSRENIPLGSGKTGSYSVLVQNIDALTPRVLAEGRVNTHRGEQHLKQLDIRLRARSTFEGLISRLSTTMNGNNFTSDSFNSNFGPYDPFLPNDNVTVGCLAFTFGAIDLGNANVFGFLATGGGDPDLGPNGKVWGKETPYGTDIDTNRIAKDFYADFDIPTAPALGVYYTSLDKSTLGGGGGGAGQAKKTTTPPGQEDKVEDPVIPPPDAPPPSEGDSSDSGAIRIGDPTGQTTEYYKLDSINLQTKDVLIIQGPVVIVVEGDIDVKGEVQVSGPHGYAEIYAHGNFTTGGNGLVNATNRAYNLQVYGTNPEKGATEFKLHGNGGLTGLVYAPNTNLTLNGGGNAGQMTGAVVAYTITINGGGSGYGFHFDEALLDLFSNGSFRMVRWRELSSAEDRAYFAQLRTRYQSYFRSQYGDGSEQATAWTGN